MDDIRRFDGENRFLSNFWPAEVVYDGVTYPSVENAYQAAKTTDPAARVPFRTMSARDAKAAGRKLKLRPDWNDVRLIVMTVLVTDKFLRHGALAERLLATGDAALVEGNVWHDNVWGTCACGACPPGWNHLGKILMDVRDILKAREARNKSERGSGPDFDRGAFDAPPDDRLVPVLEGFGDR